MYSTCLFCHRTLGANDIVEHFQVGRKLAFDSARGRLWVVCTACGQWNLTPLEERWEAVEECERLFRRTRRRVSTDQIGLARVADRYDLIRIGEPLRPEFAAWRYGAKFRARRYRSLAAGAVTLGAAAAVFGVFGLAAGIPGLLIPNYYAMRRRLNRRSELVQAERTLARIVESRVGDKRDFWGRREGEDIEVTLHSVTDTSWLLRIASRNTTLDLTGSEALHTAHLILPASNPGGAWPWSIQHAVRELEEVGDPERYFSHAVKRARKTGLHFSPIAAYPAPVRLALEMAAHEESERRAMHGELAALERAWSEAEEIAKIADDMFLPRSITEKLGELRGKRRDNRRM